MAESPPATGRPTVNRRGATAVALVVVGLLLWLAYRLTVSGENHSFAAGATPPSSVLLSEGSTYSIGVPGGTAVVKKRVGDPGDLSCRITPLGGASSALSVTPEQLTSRALNQIATFVAPTSGRAAIECAALPPVFVDDADDADTDFAGLWLVLGSIALAVGLPLLLSALRRPSPTRYE